ncbi:hypothetical protein [Thalassolituus marinus]|uniref:Uncharacterized protein n=1 Tax=Thalassolituus marinus TaxID=671053 RepID=A0ABS7ZTN8_9GAMM|nr:hypothetical protein [Thalassolituus marinus]MCA6063770.1 hypothetical protein [Thalassolituus marinus]
MDSSVRQILNPPPGETGLHQIRENLQRLIHQTDAFSVLHELLEGLDRMARNELRGADWSVRPGVSAESRLHGSLVEHPVWAALYVDNRMHPLVRRLQIFLLEAVAHHSNDLRPHDIAAMGLLIRVMPAKSAGYTDHQDIDMAVRTSGATDGQINNALRFIHAARGLRVIRRNKISGLRDGDYSRDARTGTRHDEFGSVHILVPADPDDPAQLPEVAEFVAHKKSMSTSSRDLSAARVDPGEDHSDDQMLLLVEAVRASSVERKLARRQSRTARDILARANAALPITYQQLTDTELRTLAGYIADRNYGGGTDRQCAQMALSLMLYTSSSLDDVLNMAQGAEDSGLKFDVVKNQFQIPRIKPGYTTRDTGVKNPITSSVLSDDDYVSIPNFYIRPGSIEAFKAALKEKNRKGFSEYFKQELRSMSDRITVHKIQRCAFEIARTHFDPVIVQTAFGLRVSSANVQQYYSAVSDQQIIYSYVVATREMRRRMGIKNLIDSPVMNGSPNGFYSARNMPTDRCVKSMLSRLSVDALTFKPASREWHNANTLLCIMVQALLTTIRGVFDPFVDIENGDMAVFFRDKDRPDFSHARFQFVHPLAQQVSEYYGFVREKTMAAHDLGEVGTRIFFIDEGRLVVSPRPKHIIRFMSDYWPYPLNSLRKYTRRKMVNSRISYATTNMVMNHHTVGESSWDVYSTDDPIEMRQEILAFYDQMIASLGIRREWFDVV